MKREKHYRCMPSFNLLSPARVPSWEKQDLPKESDYRRVPSFNLVVPRFPRVSFPRLVLPAFLILVLAAEVFFIYPLYQDRLALASAIKATEENLAQVESELQVAEAQRSEAQQLEAAIQALKEMRQAWDKSRQELGEISEAIGALFQAKPAEVELASIAWREGEVQVMGTASDYAALIQYRGQIRASPAISSVPSFTSQEGGTSISFSLSAQLRSQGE